MYHVTTYSKLVRSGSETRSSRGSHLLGNAHIFDDDSHSLQDLPLGTPILDIDTSCIMPHK